MCLSVTASPKLVWMEFTKSGEHVWDDLSLKGWLPWEANREMEIDEQGII